jgi:hypothetical protein
MQIKITKPSKLLNKHGELKQKGYATSPILSYRRKDVAKKLRLKEWDYYLIHNKQIVFALTVGKSLGFLLISATIINLKTNTQQTKARIRFAPCLKLPETSMTGDICYQDTRLRVAITHEKNQRILSLYMKNFEGGSDLDVSFVLSLEPKESMVIATPFQENTACFYYNQKIVGMTADGTVSLKDANYTFDPNHSFGILDWGRGVWPYKTNWYWSAACGFICNQKFGFNFGYGFGDTSAATENMLFYKGICNKLENITIHIPRNIDNQYEFMKTWHITSSDDRVDLLFQPILDRSACFGMILFSTNQHQVFGKFTGCVTLDNGTRIYIKDFLGFAEKVENKW